MRVYTVVPQHNLRQSGPAAQTAEAEGYDGVMTMENAHDPFMPLAVARESSVRLIDQAVADGSPVGVFTQRDAAVEEPTKDDLYPIGTLTHIHKMFKLADGSLRLIVQGLTRVRLVEIVSMNIWPVSKKMAPKRDIGVKN